MNKFNKTIQGFSNKIIELQVFTDGSCWPNPSDVGGWAYIIKDANGISSKNSGVVEGPNTTNNRMELTAVIQGFKALKQNKVTIELVTDSEYVGKGIAFWMPQWKRGGWRIKNSDLWRELSELVEQYNVYVTCIRGHTGQFENEECDRMASEATAKIRGKNV